MKSLAVLFAALESMPFAPLSAIDAASVNCVTPAGTELATVTANVAVCGAAPAATMPAANVQTEPALLLGAQTHPAVLPPGLKVVFAGTVSVMTTAAAPRLPPFA